MDYSVAVKEFEEFFQNTYFEEVTEAVMEDGDFIPLDLDELDKFSIELYDFLMDNPGPGISAAEEAIQSHEQVVDEVNILLEGFPEHEKTPVDLGAGDAGNFVVVTGVVKDVDMYNPELVSKTFECIQCGTNYTRQRKKMYDNDLEAPYKCECGNKSFSQVDREISDFQEIKVGGNGEVSVRLRGQNLVEKPSELKDCNITVIGRLDVRPKKGTNKHEYVIRANNYLVY